MDDGTGREHTRSSSAPRLGKPCELAGPGGVVGVGPIPLPPALAAQCGFARISPRCGQDRVPQPGNGRNPPARSSLRSAGTTSAVPPTAVATTGRPTHCASTSDTGALSENDRLMKTSWPPDTSSRWTSVSGTWPASFITREPGSAAAPCSTPGRPGPSPRCVHSTRMPVRATASTTSRIRSTRFSGMIDEALRIRRMSSGSRGLGSPRSRTPRRHSWILSAASGYLRAR